LEILDAKKMLKDNFENQFRVKNISDNDTAKYVVLFYILNNSKIPAKYLKYKNAFLNSNKVNDNIFLEYFENNTNKKDKLIKIINSNPRNKGINYLKNTFLYYMDSIKKFKNKGFILTFSGVDGAGKSTIIENISTMIEKQLRKPIVVIRHRPSILPILSVYTKGKEKAHLDTISSLPRQGNNKSFFSSLLRFGYYYMDYFVGQFYIYFKYVSKGTVVIYDRYYFDFINDSKRSNIVLPKKLTSFGYTFLLKPNFNFFLYADAEVILKRKEELTKETIEALTKDYTELFVRLQEKNKSSIYLPINNLVLEETLDKIMKTITK
jgi:thymidylate kinase